MRSMVLGTVNRTVTEGTGLVPKPEAYLASGFGQEVAYGEDPAGDRLKQPKTYT